MKQKPIPKPSIVEVFESYGSKVHSGFGWVKAQCVLHEDRNPSASINDEACRWRCFSCGESGDAVDLIMKVDDIGYREAIAVAEGFGGDDGTTLRSTGLTPSRSSASGRAGQKAWTPAWKSF